MNNPPKFVFFLFLLSATLCTLTWKVSQVHAQETKPDATKADAAKPATTPKPTIESLQKEITDRDNLINWHTQREAQLETQLNGLQMYCNATITIKQLDGLKPQPQATPTTPAPATPAKK